MDKFLEMQTFSAVVDAGSFVKAAAVLGQSKAAMSRYVGELETRLGVRLMQRTTRRLSLTEEGQVFYTRCKECWPVLTKPRLKLAPAAALPAACCGSMPR